VKPHLNIIGMASVFMLWGCASVPDDDGALATVPYEIHADRGIVIEVQVNGQGPFKFALDTAATISVVFDDLSRQLELEPASENVIMIHGLVGSGEFPMISVNQLSVGGEVWNDPLIAAMPGKAVSHIGIDGILGIDFLRRYAVRFSTEDHVVRLYPPERLNEKSYWGWTSVPLELLEIGDTKTSLYFFEIEVGDLKMPAIFDLGAGLNMMNWAAASDLGLDPVELRDEDQVSGAIESTPIVARVRARDVRTGGIHWRNEEFMIAELDIFTTLKHDATPCAILGAGLFTQRDFIIDFARGRLLVKTAMNETTGSEPGRR
jgi:predicted aspartyl protease